MLPPSLMVFFCKPSQGSVHYVLPCARLQSYMGPGHSQVGAHAINHVNKSQPRTGLNKLSANKHINIWPRQTSDNVSWILLGPSKERLLNPQSLVLSRYQCGLSILVITTKPKSRIIMFVVDTRSRHGYSRWWYILILRRWPYFFCNYLFCKLCKYKREREQYLLVQ